MAIRVAPPSPAVARFGATRRAGAATDLALRIRRHGVVTWNQLEIFAQAASIDVEELRLMIAPLLEQAGVVDISRDGHGQPAAVEEHVGVGAPVLEQCAEMWERCDPGDLESCAVDTADHCSYRPLLASELQTALEVAGHVESVQDEAFAALRTLGLLRVETSTRFAEEVFYSPHVWGSDAVKIAEFMAGLPPNEREVLGRAARAAADRPGIDLTTVAGDTKFLRSARKVGLIDAARVVTTAGNDRAFGFPPGLEHHLPPGSTDVTHERKLFVAHIVFGHRYGYPGTGRIRDPLVLVSALLNRGEVGPATAIRTDYPLLEAHGIVRVQETQGTMATLELVKKDVAEDSLDLLRLALGDAETTADRDDPMQALWVPGAAFRVPEQDRAELPEPTAGAEVEVIRSTVEHLREETAKRMRGEIV